MIEIRNLKKYFPIKGGFFNKNYDEVKAVENVNFKIPEGEILGLVGESGSGKSSLARSILGIEDYSGKINFNDQNIKDFTKKQKKDFKKNCQLVFQDPFSSLSPRQKIFNIVKEGLDIHEPYLSNQEKKEKVYDVINEVKLAEDDLNKYPHEFSGGQRQRVAMGRAIVRDPQVFLFDEPLSNLDAKLRVQMRAEIRELHQRLKSTTLYVTHDQIEAMTMADKIVVMQNGFIEQIGSPLELYDRPDNIFVAGFIGSPAMNLLQGTVKKSGKNFVAEIYGGQFSLPKAKNLTVGQDIILGIRPEQLIPGKKGIAATVSVVEPTGSETHLIVRSGEQELISVVRERSNFSIGEQINLFADKNFLHVFDAKSSKRLNDD